MLSPQPLQANTQPHGALCLPLTDHSYWGRPEEQTGARPAYVWDASKPASDAAGAAASALAAASLVFRSSDAEYADACLDHARRLFEFASQVGLLAGLARTACACGAPLQCQLSTAPW